MRKTIVIALALAAGALGLTEAATPAAAAGSPASFEQVRTDAMARLASGDILTVKHRRHHSNGYAGNGWPNGSGHYRGKRHWGGSHWDRRRHWSHSDRRHSRRHHW